MMHVMHLNELARWSEFLFGMAGLFFFARWFAGFGVGAPYLPVRPQDIKDGMALADIKPEDVVVDLGSGDGRILVAAAERGARVIGYELNPFLVWVSRYRLKRFGDRARIYNQNLLTADLSGVTIIFLFGISSLMPKIAQMIETKKTGPVRVISFAFSFPGRTTEVEKGIAKCYLFGERSPVDFLRKS